MVAVAAAAGAAGYPIADNVVARVTLTFHGHRRRAAAAVRRQCRRNVDDDENAAGFVFAPRRHNEIVASAAR